MYSLIRKFLFLLPTETSHYLSLYTVKILHRLHLLGLIAVRPEQKTITVMGLEFPHSVGLAAGLDKNADYIDSLAALGFGFIEVGTVTPVAQQGNPHPRLFRLPHARAIINRMGFNNNGVDYLVQRVVNSSYKGILGINIGKNKDTPPEKAVDDYLICMRKVYPHASYIAVNLSSPNTPGLRDLQFGEPLELLLDQLKQEQKKLAVEFNRYVPIAVKIAPDLADDDVEKVAKSLLKYELDGVIATNTTIARDKVKHLKYGGEMGGLSGAPLTDASTRVIGVLARVIDQSEGVLPIIGVGGIMSGDDAAAKTKAGASLVQLYTGFIYDGPSLIRDSAKEIALLS
ncbi:MAG: dihydroorotate dehydrogenase [Oceanicoccus sp.]|jgi:dihydroorotate dehydrogenase